MRWAGDVHEMLVLSHVSGVHHKKLVRCQIVRPAKSTYACDWVNPFRVGPVGDQLQLFRCDATRRQLFNECLTETNDSISLAIRKSLDSTGHTNRNSFL